MSDLLPLVHAFATLAMVGIIWFVQVVHYPLFSFAAHETFSSFAAAHRFRTALIVGPLMLAELLAATGLAIAPPPGRERTAWLGLLLLAAIWLSTAAVQVPLHRRLESGFTADEVRRLVGSNWLRTVAWSARAVVALTLLRNPPS